METTWILHTPSPDLSFYLFVYSATFIAYNVYYLGTDSHPHALIYTLLGCAGVVVGYHYSTFISVSVVSSIAVISMLYLFPIVFKTKRSALAHWIRFAILVLVWTTTTGILPHTYGALTLNEWHFIFIRFLFLWNITMLFLIRDESHHFAPHILQRILLGTLLLQFIVGLAYIHLNMIFGLIFGIMTIMIALIAYDTQRQPKSKYYYLAVVDGTMCIEALLVFFVPMFFSH